MSIIEKALEKVEKDAAVKAEKMPPAVDDPVQKSEQTASVQEHKPEVEANPAPAPAGDDNVGSQAPATSTHDPLEFIGEKVSGEQSLPVEPVEPLATAGSDFIPASNAPEGKPDPLATAEDLLVKIPFDELNAEGMITPQSPRSAIAEEYRTIKRPLLHNIAGKGAVNIEHANLIMVTSAIQGDGKTFSAINLALSIAMEQDKTVLFVDADVSKATACTRLGVPESSPGLIDVLEHSDLQLGDVMMRTNIQNLRILPAGNVHERSTELLASESMRKLMLELSSRYPDRVIVFDSPPLLQTTEAAVLANLVGQIMFVVSAERTPASAVKDAIELIRKDQVIGLVLNRTLRHRHGKHGYAYGYGYGRRTEPQQT